MNFVVWIIVGSSISWTASLVMRYECATAWPPNIVASVCWRIRGLGLNKRVMKELP